MKIKNESKCIILSRTRSWTFVIHFQITKLFLFLLNVWLQDFSMMIFLFIFSSYKLHVLLQHGFVREGRSRLFLPFLVSTISVVEDSSVATWCKYRISWGMKCFAAFFIHPASNISALGSKANTRLSMLCFSNVRCLCALLWMLFKLYGHMTHISEHNSMLLLLHFCSEYIIPRLFSLHASHIFTQKRLTKWFLSAKSKTKFQIVLLSRNAEIIAIKSKQIKHLIFPSLEVFNVSREKWYSALIHATLIQRTIAAPGAAELFLYCFKQGFKPYLNLYHVLFAFYALQYVGKFRILQPWLIAVFNQHQIHYFKFLLSSFTRSNRNNHCV